MAPDGAPPLFTLARRDPGELAITDGRRSLTWAELESETNAFGRGLEAHGLGPGDHVSVVARNHVEYLVAVIGIQRAGMVVTPVKTGWTPSEIGYLLHDAGSRAVVTDVASGREAAAQSGVALVDLERDYPAWIAQQSTEPFPYDRTGWRLSYTSGTTGRPKGVIRDDSGTTPFSDAFAASAAFAGALQIPRDGLHLVVSRLFHGAPLAFALSALAAGTPLFVMERWDATTAIDHLASGMASTIMVPTMFRQMLALPDEVRARLPVPSLGVVIHGGEPCPIGLKQRMIAWLGPVFVEYFGVSEGGMTLASSADWLARPGTVGQIHTAAGIVILDDDGNEVPPRTEGGVYFRSSGNGFRYKGDPEKTASAFRGNAFTAGDIGWVDDDGYLFLSGRRADVIVSAGVNVYPAEIETELEMVPGVADLCVVGAPHDERGEIPVAVVVVAAGHAPDAVIAALEARGAEHLAGYKRPARFVVEDSLPRDDTGKLLRRQVRDRMWGDASPFAGPLG
ncbi:MAG: AMP-binding protein [Actinomycetota bacterium]